jgi:HEPN domain-containing protein
MQTEYGGQDDAREWLRRARSNLVRATEDSRLEGVAVEDLCFDAQQAVEKSLKAVLVCRGVAFPRTHVIFDLLTLIQQSGMEVPGGVREAAVLTPYAVSARYPPLPLPISPEDYTRALELAERVYRWAESSIV